jgi:predicted Zn-ribbon and HTH transcriptional regulator
VIFWTAAQSDSIGIVARELSRKVECPPSPPPGLAGFPRVRRISIGHACVIACASAPLVDTVATRKPSGEQGGKVDERLTTTAAIETIWARRNRRRTIWTPSILLERIGIARHPSTPVALHKQAARILRELWRAGKLVRRVALNRDHLLEAAYMRPEDKPPLYFEACDKCGFPRLARYGRAESCRKCAGEQIDENRYYAQSPEETHSTYPVYTDPPAGPAH